MFHHLRPSRYLDITFSDAEQATLWALGLRRRRLRGRGGATRGLGSGRTSREEREAGQIPVACSCSSPQPSSPSASETFEGLGPGAQRFVERSSASLARRAYPYLDDEDSARRGSGTTTPSASW